MDTIFALASAAGKAGVAVIRVSGPAAWGAGRALAGTLPAPRRAGLRVLRDSDGRQIDTGLVLSFTKGASFTGEDVVEFQVHGSMAVIDAVLRRLGALPDLRMAEPGEFTRRALQNGQMDLSQVEALGDLLDAETEAQRLQAQRVLSGALADRVDRWRRDIVRAAALLEAVIDFSDDDVPQDVTPEVRRLLSGVATDLRTQIDGAGAAERVRSGFEVAIVGPPNAGKSTLLNYLAGRDAAITSEIAGTTRDVIEVRMEIGGQAVTLLDTAGLRDTDDRVEALGVDLARRRAQAADLRIHLLPKGVDPLMAVTSDDLVVAAKADLTGVGVSGVTGQGVAALLQQVSDRLAGRASGAGLAIRERHRQAMLHGVQALEVSLGLLEDGPDRYDIASEELRSAARALAALVGRVDVEDLLDEIFASFCLGK